MLGDPLFGEKLLARLHQFSVACSSCKNLSQKSQEFAETGTSQSPVEASSAQELRCHIIQALEFLRNVFTVHDRTDAASLNEDVPFCDHRLGLSRCRVCGGGGHVLVHGGAAAAAATPADTYNSRPH
ncbi:hypothetical protein FHG87_001426 [Trinorchestia longiramus]|nr:hypothetical protein FHG87_001426 [Trinorchestia longiramus]